MDSNCTVHYTLIEHSDRWMCALKLSNRTLSDQLIIAMLEYNTSTMENIENVVGKNY